MNTIGGAVEALCRELEEAVRRRRTSPGAACVRVGAATVSLNLVMAGARAAGVGAPDEATEARWRVAEASDVGLIQHVLTLRLRVDEPVGPDGSATAEVQPSPANASGAEAVADRDQAVLAACAAEVFGPPGFDNAARAEVFCEIVAAATQDEIETALGFVCSGAVVSAAEPVARSVSRLRQILGFAPAGVVAAAARLRGLLSEHGAAAVGQVIKRNWRFGAE